MANKTSKGDAARYTAYKASDRVTKNKTRKLAKHLKKHPNDVQSASALKAGVGYRRRVPTAKNGWVTESVRSYVQQFSMHFQYSKVVYKDLPTMGRYNSMKVAQALRLSHSVQNTVTYPASKADVTA